MLRTSHLAAISLAFILAFRAWQVPFGFSLWDEGYLWYGIQRVGHSDVPIRDFMAYDPARYYIYAAIARLFGGDGLWQMRWVMNVVQAIALFACLWMLAAATARRSWLLVLIAMPMLAALMQPNFKTLDFVLCPVLIAALARLMRRADQCGHIVVGVCVGLAAVLGRDHGVYSAVASLGVMLWLKMQPHEGVGFFKGAACMTLGVVIGYSPMLLMFALVPGFAQAMWDSILQMFAYGSTNIAMPVPWPWRAQPWWGLRDAYRPELIGLLFIAVIVFCVVSIPFVIIQRRRNLPISPAFVACAFLALPYAHYAFSRADSFHLVISLFPVAIGCMILIADLPAKFRLPIAATMCAACMWAFAPMQNGWECVHNRKCVQTEIAGHNFIIDPITADGIGLLRGLIAQYAPNGRAFLVEPLWPGAYAVAGQRAPIWEIFPLFPRSEAFQQAEIARLKASDPGFALVYNFKVDGRADLLFQQTHALTYQYILDHFDRVEDPAHPDFEIYKARNTTQPGQT